MRTTADYLDLLRQKYDLPSDYALRKLTGWKPQHISYYRTKKTTFNDETAMKVAAWLDMPASEIIIDMHAQRSRENPALYAVWSSIGKKNLGAALGIMACAVLLHFATGASGEVWELAQALILGFVRSEIHIMCILAGLFWLARSRALRGRLAPYG